jgi:hypothetical protein
VDVFAVDGGVDEEEETELLDDVGFVEVDVVVDVVVGVVVGSGVVVVAVAVVVVDAEDDVGVAVGSGDKLKDRGIAEGSITRDGANTLKLIRLFKLKDIKGPLPM